MKIGAYLGTEEDYCVTDIYGGLCSNYYFHETTTLHCEISGSHGGEYENDCLLGCCAV
jgi:hypothetical protein